MTDPSAPARFSPQRLVQLAARAVHKVDLLGPRGTTLCSMDEIEAMACLLALSGMLPPPGEPTVTETPKFTTRRDKT